MTRIALVTAKTLPKPEIDTALLADALIARGAQVLVIPWDDLEPSAEWDAVVIRSTWDYHGRREEFLAWTRAVTAVTRLINPIEDILWTSHKAYVADLPAMGVPAIPTLVLSQVEALAASTSGAVAAWMGDHRESTDFVVKPAVSVGGFGAERVLAADVVDAVVRVGGSGDVVVQPLIESVLEYGEVSLVLFDGVVHHAVRKVGASGQFLIHDHHGGRVLPHDPAPDEIAVAAVATAAAPSPPLYARVDMLRGAEGPLVIEIELIEPQLFLEVHPEAPDRLAQVLIRVLEN